MDTKYYEIDGLNIEWGKPLNEVRLMLEGFEKFKPFGGWPNIRCKCSGIFGLTTTEFEARAPFEDRPVLQVQYEISPMKPGFSENLHSPYLKQLKKHLGKPHKAEKLYKQTHLKKEYLSGAVVFSATWLFDDIRISLSVYGGTRNNDSGPSAAGIFIDWIDEVKAANPFRNIDEKFEILLKEYLDDDTTIQKYQLKNKQRPFSMIHYELPDPYIAEKDHYLRASQLALYRKGIYLTPEIIQAKLAEDELGYYKVPELNKIFISNKWDTVYLTPTNEDKITFFEILPARGSGGRRLDINGFQIEDAKDSSTLLDLIRQIENDFGRKIERKETYDD